jgi:hypothetical protein
MANWTDALNFGGQTERCLPKPVAVSALAVKYEMSFAAVQKHVVVLEKAGLLTKRRTGREQVGSGDVAAVRSMASMLTELEQVWRDRIARIDELIAASPSCRCVGLAVVGENSAPTFRERRDLLLAWLPRSKPSTCPALRTFFTSSAHTTRPRRWPPSSADTHSKFRPDIDTDRSSRCVITNGKSTFTAARSPSRTGGMSASAPSRGPLAAGSWGWSAEAPTSSAEGAAAPPWWWGW